MAVITMHTTTTTLLPLALLLVIIYRLARSLHRTYQFRAFARAHHAAAASSSSSSAAPPTIPHARYLLGFDHFATILRHATGHTLLAHVSGLFATLGVATFVEPRVAGGLLGSGGLITRDPANVKAVLATQFEDFTFQPGRSDLHPFLGAGIFSADGGRWAAMRGRLRPWFGRVAGGGVGGAGGRLVSLDLYDLAGRSEGSVQTLLRRLRAMWACGKTVDLAPLFFRMLMEVACPMVLGDDPDVAPDDDGNGGSGSTEKAGAGTLYRNQRTWHRLGGWGVGIAAGVPHGHDISYAEFEEAFDYCTEWFSNGGDINIFGIGLPNERFHRDCNLVNTFVEARAADAIARRASTDKPDAVSAEAAKTRTRPGALVDHLAAAQPALSQDALRQEAFNILFAARDTTAGTLCDLFWLLARHPRVLGCLRDEILTHFPAATTAPADVTFERVKQLPYLNAAIKETLRLHPVLPMNGKFAAKDTTLPRGGGPDGSQPVALMKGTQVGWVPWALHRIPEVYGEDVDVMRPERWLDGGGDDGWLEDEHHEGAREKSKGIRPGWAYIPFNGGPRTCIGQQFALGTLSYVTVRMVQEMDKAGVRIESRDERPWTEKFSITAKNLHGCLVAFVDAEAS